MTKAVISNRIYFKASPEVISELAKKLTYKIIINPGGSIRFQNVEIIRNYKLIDKETISIPQGRIDLVPTGYEIVDKRSLVPVEWPAPKIPLYAEQQVIHDQVDDTCFINALVGWGKCFAPSLSN